MSTDATTKPQQGPPLSAGEILQNAQALATKIHEADLASEYDKLRKLPTDIVEQVRATGVMRMNMPGIWGGPEMSAMEQVEVIEALSRADASVGWCSFIWCDSGIYSGYLDDAVGRSMYPRLDMATSGWVYPVGQAHRVEGGYRLSGQWMFGSGCNHCDWLAAGCIVYRDGETELDPSGKPLWRILMAQPEEYEIQDTWYTTGLRGTGSNDYRCEDLFVPEEHSFSFQEPAKRTGTIWAKPDHLLRKMAGVPLGVAADAIDYAKLALSDKLDRRTGVLYRDMPKVQYAIAEAHSILGGARSYVFSSLEAQWRRLEVGQPLTEEERANAWLSRTNAFQAGRQVVSLIYDTIGGNAIYARKSPLDRHLRDINTACQHMVAQTRNMEGVGSLLLGGEPSNSMM
ncbi:MAG: acyl-CoA dehydrogenase family protein [Pseudomonadales bacterium]